MRDKIRVLLPTILTVVVAIAAGMVIRLSIPKAKAQTTVKWQYKCIESNLNDRNPKRALQKLEKTANIFGADGWELATESLGTYWCFKRRK